MTIKIIPVDRIGKNGKVADAELHFSDAPLLAGVRLVGFSIWKRERIAIQDGDVPGEVYHTVSWPARQYNVNGEHRQFALLRVIDDNAALDPLRHAILAAWDAHQKAGWDVA